MCHVGVLSFKHPGQKKVTILEVLRVVEVQALALAQLVSVYDVLQVAKQRCRGVGYISDVKACLALKA